MSPFKTTLASLVLLLSFSPTAVAQEPEISLATGYIYGDREDNLGLKTQVAIVPISVSLKYQQWLFKMSTAHLAITGPGDIFIEEYDNDRADLLIETDRKRSGMGDTFLSATFSPRQLKSNKYKLSFSYKYKSPTGNENKGLSSGEADHHFYGRGFYRVQRFLILGRLGYQIMGDTEFEDYNNRIFGSLGLLYIKSRQLSFGSQYYFKQASLDSREDIKNISLVLQYRPDKSWSIAVNYIKGLSDTTLDNQYGLQVSHHF